MYELDPETYLPFELLGICTVNAETETKILSLGKMYRDLGKEVYAICDKQTPEIEAELTSGLDLLLMHEEKGFEQLVVEGTTEEALERFIDLVGWPDALKTKIADPKEDIKKSALLYFRKYKGEGSISDFFTQCTEAEIPEWVRTACVLLKDRCVPKIIVDDEDDIAAEEA